jgi:hypothetical protein
MSIAADAGVLAILFGDGVGESAHGRGLPPPDGYWWNHPNAGVSAGRLTVEEKTTHHQDTKDSKTRWPNAHRLGDRGARGGEIFSQDPASS